MSSRRTCVLITLVVITEHCRVWQCMIQNDALSVRALLVCTMILTLAWRRHLFPPSVSLATYSGIHNECPLSFRIAQRTSKTQEWGS
ncbi:hypothetical protein EDB85DRAFT_1918390 [Lactarius pseudohatsudake]|nr:hypothetical protein EDB85DRAFT_1918390 [Lactarius pseudohatsudake]